jgi:3-hydroxy-D-aspartate aldolase
MAATRSAIVQCQQTRNLLQLAGLECAVISGAGTGTWEQEAASQIYTEVQPGTYPFMDADYARNRTADGHSCEEFEQSLFVWTTIMSRPTADRAVVDAGLKAVGIDKGMPRVHGVDGAEYVRASDEHGILNVQGAPERVQLGSKLRLVPGNCDPTVNLHDWLVAIRRGRVEALWPISGRGPGL